MIVDSPVDSAVNEYARVTRMTVVRPPSLPTGDVGFRGEGSAEALARELAANLRSQGIRLVAIGEDRMAAVPSNRPLLRGNPTGNGGVIAQFLTGLGVVLVAGYYGIRAAGSSACKTTVTTP